MLSYFDLLSRKTPPPRWVGRGVNNVSIFSTVHDLLTVHDTFRVWSSPKLSVKTNMIVCNACVISTLLYGSETWTMHAGQERILNSFHLRSIRGILVVSWQDKVTNADVLYRAGLPTMYTLLRQRRLRWLGHVRRMEDGRIPKCILYGELALGRRTTGRPHLR